MGLLLVAFLILTAVIFSGYRRITVVSGKDLVQSCPGYAKPGATVTVMTAVISDGELYVNGVEGAFVRPGEFRFVMPDEDVELKATVVAFPDGA